MDTGKAISSISFSIHTYLGKKNEPWETILWGTNCKEWGMTNMRGSHIHSTQ